MPRIDMTRHPEMGTRDMKQLQALLDSTFLAHVGLLVDGFPFVVPTGLACEGDRLLIHGSTASGWMRELARGVDACVTVTELDAIVVARSAFESSFRYRSAVFFGQFRPVDDHEQQAALDVLLDRLIPGRRAEVRPSSTRELAATLVLAMPLEQWSLRVSDDWPDDDEADVAGPTWAGVVPLQTVFGEPVPAPDLHEGIDLPASVRTLRATGPDGRTG